MTDHLRVAQDALAEMLNLGVKIETPTVAQRKVRDKLMKQLTKAAVALHYLEVEQR